MNVKLVVVIALFVLAIGGGIAYALTEGGIEYRTVSQVTSDNYDGERVMMKTQVLEVMNDIKPVVFLASDIPAENTKPDPNAPVFKVIYEGDDAPTGLKKAAHVTLTGRFDKERNAFIASKMQTQCPSRYEGEELKPLDNTSSETPSP